MPRAKKKSKVPPPFAFPSLPHKRVHGPQGHVDYGNYKPWLRDEFEFRCVYCLTRELWSFFGKNIFEIDHVLPQKTHPRLTCDYDNLVYACGDCNSLKSDRAGLPDPCRTSMARHVRLLPDGKFAGVTPQGKRMVEYLRLNVPEKVASRSRLLYIFENQDRFGGPLLDYFRYPLDLPDLSVLKPPGKNSRPRGVALSHLARKAKRVLPEYY